jgi:hypothetical protein
MKCQALEGKTLSGFLNYSLDGLRPDVYAPEQAFLADWTDVAPAK